MGLKIGNLETYGIIYKIENLINGKVYIGQTTSMNGFNGRYEAKGNDIERIYNYNLYVKKSKNTYNTHIVSSIEKYGFENFYVNKVFDIAFSKEELDIKEKLWIKYYDSTNPKYGYNNREGGEGGKYTRLREIKNSINNNNFIICRNDGMIFINSRECSKYYKINRYTVRNGILRNKRLKNGLLFEKYDVNKSKRKAIICLNTLEIFPSYEFASKIFKVSGSTIREHCKNKRHEMKTCNGIFTFRNLKDIYDDFNLIYDIK